MHPSTGDQLTDLERGALEAGLARVYRGRVIPIIRGGDETAEEKAAREAAEAEAAANAKAEAESAAAKTFSQAELDRIIQDRLARQKEQFKGYDELKEKASKFDELEAANATELEKASARAEAAEKRATEIEAESKETRIRSAIIAEAAKPDRKVVDPEAVVTLLDRSTLELDDAGLPTNIAEAMDSLLEKRPYLVAQDGGSRGDADQGARGGGNNQLSESDLKSMTPEQIVAARKAGRLTGLGVGS